MTAHLAACADVTSGSTGRIVAMASADVKYRVRPAAAADLRAVWEVMAENRAVAPPEAEECRPDEVSRVHRVAWERMMDTSDLSVYVAECGTEAVGTASMLVVPNLAYGCRPTAFIEPVVVKYRHRRRGVARALLNQALADARSLGCFKVQLLSHKRHADDGAHDLYRSVGFDAEAEGFRLYLPQD